MVDREKKLAEVLEPLGVVIEHLPGFESVEKYILGKNEGKSLGSIAL